MTNDLQARLDRAWLRAQGRADWGTAERNARYETLVDEAARRPELRDLFPFTSHNRLCFSRSSDYPFTIDCPCVVFGQDGYVVQATWVVSDEDVTVLLGLTESARTAVDVLVQNLPEERGAWVGTSDDEGN